MRVLFSVQSYKPFTDGVQMVTAYHAEGLIKRGHEVTVITCKGGNLSEEEIINGVKIFRYPLYIRHTFYGGDKAGYIDKFKYLADESDVVINVCTQTPFTDLILPVLKELKCKKILYLHSMINFRWEDADKENIKNVLHKIWNNVRWGVFYNRAKKYVKEYNRVVQIHETDPAVKFYKRKYGIDSEIIMNAVDDIFFEKKRSSIVDSNPYFIMVANYLPLKNHEFVLRAFYKAKLDLKYGMVFIGSKETEYYHSLVTLNKELAKEYGIYNVQFLTGIQRENLSEYVRNAKIYLFGSRVEKFPLAIMEAMACGTPYISTDVGCVRLLPGGVTILSVEEMAYWINIFCQNEKIRLCTGEAGRIYAKENFRIEQKVSQLERIIQEVCYE